MPCRDRQFSRTNCPKPTSKKFREPSRSGDDHGTRMPEVALRFPSHMASCPRYDRSARTASCRRSLATRICRADVRPRQYVSHVGQRAPPRANADATAGSSGGRASRATDRAAAPRPAGQRAPRPPPNVAGCRPNRETRRTLLGEVGVRLARPIRHAGGRRAVHGHPLPAVRRAADVSVSPIGDSGRLRAAAEGPSSSAPTHPRRIGPTHWRRRKGRHLPVGVEKENAVAGPLATHPAVGPPECAPARREHH
jgi:hypothetical protein